MFILAECTRLLFVCYVGWVFGVLPLVTFFHQSAPCFVGPGSRVVRIQQVLALTLGVAVGVQATLELGMVCLGRRATGRVQALKRAYYLFGLVLAFFIVWHGVIGWVEFRRSPCFSETLGNVLVLPGPISIPPIPDLLPPIPTLPAKLPVNIPDIGKLPDSYLAPPVAPDQLPDPAAALPEAILTTRPAPPRPRQRRALDDLDPDPQRQPLAAIADNAGDILSDLRPEPVVRNALALALDVPLLRVTYGVGTILHILVGSFMLLLCIGRLATLD